MMEVSSRFGVGADRGDVGGPWGRYGSSRCSVASGPTSHGYLIYVMGCGHLCYGFVIGWFTAWMPKRKQENTDDFLYFYFDARIGRSREPSETCHCSADRLPARLSASRINVGCGAQLKVRFICDRWSGADTMVALVPKLCRSKIAFLQPGGRPRT